MKFMSLDETLHKKKAQRKKKELLLSGDDKQNKILNNSSCERVLYEVHDKCLAWGELRRHKKDEKLYSDEHEVMKILMRSIITSVKNVILMSVIKWRR